MKRLLILFIAPFLFCTACKHEMRPIEYGKDNCEQCRMTVMNPQFAAAMLTSKGKTYAFDAEECLVRYLKAKEIHENDQYFVSDYNKPGSLINAVTAIYLHSDNIQSPMGGNLAAFSDEASAENVQKELGGEVLNWQQLTSK